MTKFVAIDIETTGLNFQKDITLCVGFSDGYFFNIDKITQIQEHINTLKTLGHTIVGQNLSFDCKFLWEAGIKIENDWDTMLAAYLLTDRPGKLSLDSLASYYLGTVSWKQDFKSGDAYKDPELMRMYCITDCQQTEKLAYILEQKLKDEDKLEFFHKLMAARRMLTKAEYSGVSFDDQKAKKIITELKTEWEIQLNRLNDIGRNYIESISQGKAKKPKTFNWNSPTQVKWLLKEKLGLSVIHPLTHEESADIAVLEMNADKHPLIPELIKMRETKKLMGTLEGYIETLGTDGRLHADFNMHRTVTGRLSSSGDLNIQQVDKQARVRALFTADPGEDLVIYDLPQIEPRFAAHYSKDPVLTAMFQNEEDLYGTIAKEILGAPCAPNEVKRLYPEKRQVAKVIGLSVLYGIGVNKLAQTIRNDGGVANFGISDARQIIDNYFTKFAGLKDLQMGVHRTIVQRGYLNNFEGRKVNVSEDKIHRDGVNTLLQSSASDYMLFKTVAFEVRAAELGAKLKILCHDEALYSVPKENSQQFAKELEEHMANAPTLRVPIKSHSVIGNTWACKE